MRMSDGKASIYGRMSSLLSLVQGPTVFVVLDVSHSYLRAAQLNNSTHRPSLQRSTL